MIKILKQTLTKVCASKLTNKEWDICLPLAVTSINRSNPGGAPLSRLRLLYSPFIFDEQPMVLANPVRTQQQSYNYLNTITLSAGFDNINLLKLSLAALGARTCRTTKKTLRSMLHVECSIFFSSDIRTDMIGSSPRYIQIILASTNNITFNMKDMTQIY